MARHRAARQELEAAWNTRREQVWHGTPISITRVVAELESALGERYAERGARVHADSLAERRLGFSRNLARTWAVTAGRVSARGRH